jgi:GH15 family glucan-1,4-alpha-glucosidase
VPLRIEDYALVGDCHSAALIGNDGSVDWLCFPRFDSGAHVGLVNTAFNLARGECARTRAALRAGR